MEKGKKVFRDPIYNLIEFDKENEKIIINLINSKEMQRLKRIKQLGLISYVYPSGVHDRFTHALGVAYLAGLVFDKIKKEEKFAFTFHKKGYIIKHHELKLIVQIAGLLHDVGHGPFSHTFESVTKVEHEKISQLIIENEKSEINSILKTFPNAKLKEDIPTFISLILQKTFPISWVNDIISSQIDADRLDYLLRDAYMCGVEYARFDWQWLVNNITVEQTDKNIDKQHIIIDAQKGLPALESFITSRYHMYEQVYFHKTCRGAEALLKLILQRTKELINLGKVDKLGYICKNLKNFLELKHDKKEIPELLNEFQALDDAILMTHFLTWSREAKDEILRECSHCLVNRKLYKMINPNVPYTKDDVLHFFEGDKEKSEYYFFADDYSNNPYKDEYLLGLKTENEVRRIWIREKSGEIAPLEKSSAIVNSLRNNIKKEHREYIHRDYYENFIHFISQKHHTPLF